MVRTRKESTTMSNSTVSLIDLMAADDTKDVSAFFAYRRLVDLDALAEDAQFNDESSQWEEEDVEEFFEWVRVNRDAVDYMLMTHFEELLNDTLDAVMQGEFASDIYQETLLPEMGVKLLSMWRNAHAVEE